MRSIILQVNNFTFVVNGISHLNTYEEQQDAFKVIFKYLSNNCRDKFNSENITLSSFSIMNRQNAYSLTNVVADGDFLKGRLLSEIVSLKIDHLVFLDIKDVNLLDVERFTPTFTEENNIFKMKRSSDGEYVSYDEYQDLQNKFIELKNQLNLVKK